MVIIIITITINRIGWIKDFQEIKLNNQKKYISNLIMIKKIIAVKKKKEEKMKI